MKHVVRRALPWLVLALLGLGVASSCGTQQGEQQLDARSAEEEPTAAETTTRAAAPPADGRTAEEPTAATRGGWADEEVNMQLIEAGADVNAKDDTEQSAYLISTSEVGDDPRLLELTLRNDADVGSLDSYDGTGLIRAADRGHVRIVERLLQTETDVDHVNNLGWTALLEAIILGEGDARHTEVVRLLVEEGGADPNIPDGEGVTPLQHAEQRGYSEMAEILRSAGAG